MLSESQVVFIGTVSGAALGGLVLGTLCGLLVGPAVRFLKTRNAQGFFSGIVLSIVPGAMVASLIAMSCALVATTVFPPGHKGGYDAPDWFAAVMVILPLLAGAVAACCAAHADPPIESHVRTLAHSILWAVGGGLLSSLAFVGEGFSGYFVVQNNSGPIGYAVFGFVFGSAIAGLSRWATAALGHSLNASGKAHSLA
jgi:hypothetical protein